jgi:phosphoribosylanthranilate isomerase
MLHYHTKHPERMRADVNALVTATGAPAVQLNMAWPNRDDIAALVDKHAGLNVVLQLPARAMDGLTTEQIADHATQYNGLAAYALIDRSGGTGVAFELEPTAVLVRALEDAMPRTMIVVAGGFTPENVGERLRFLDGRAKRPYAIDAESGVMTDNALDMHKIEAYLTQAASVRA